MMLFAALGRSWMLGVFDKFLEKVVVIRIRVSMSEDDEAADRVAETLP